jgi:hypothetical protein
MPLVGFEPTTPVFEGTKAIHALDREAAVVGSGMSTLSYYCLNIVYFCIEIFWFLFFYCTPAGT